MKKIYFLLEAVVIVAGYFGLCYLISPFISVRSWNIFPLLFAVINLVELMFCIVLLLFFILYETEAHSLKGLWLEARELFLLVAFVLLFFLPLTLFLFDAFGYVQGIDYPLLAFLPSNVLFVFVAYKMFEQWVKIKKAIVVLQEVLPIAVSKNAIIDTSVPLMPILWMGDKNHSLCKYIAKKYADVVVWNDISSYDSRRNLDRISGMGTLVISHPLPARQKKFVSFAMTKGIAVIIVVKNKNAHAVGKAYGAHCFICQTDNRADYGCSLLSRLIEEHGKRIKS